MNRGLLVTCLLFCCGLVGWSEPKTDPTLADLEKQAAAIKPTPSELRWRQIPWVLDLTEGQRLAQEEGRPIFLWVTGDEPLERC
jgi:hypothetical protein